MIKIRNIKIFFQKVTCQIGLKNFLWLKKLKNLWIYVINDLNKEKIIGTFCLNEFQKKKSKRVYNWKCNKEKRR